jgi:Pyruvate/2-oxoacid:ferredoxin oxidoreductase delta subunit
LSSPFEYDNEGTNKKPIFVSNRSIRDPEAGTGEKCAMWGIVKAKFSSTALSQCLYCSTNCPPQSFPVRQMLKPFDYGI